VKLTPDLFSLLQRPRTQWSTCSVEDLNVLYNSYGTSNFCLSQEEPTYSQGLIIVGYGSDSKFVTSDRPDIIYSGSIVGTCMKPPAYPHFFLDRIVSAYFEGSAVVCGGLNSDLIYVWENFLNLFSFYR